MKRFLMDVKGPICGCRADVSLLLKRTTVLLTGFCPAERDSWVCFFLSLRINKAADFKDHKIQVASCLISLKVEPSPALSINLSGAPLIKIVLTHVLVGLTSNNVLVCALGHVCTDMGP